MSDNKDISTVDEYVASFSDDIQTRMITIRNIIKKVAPHALEKISWGAPTYYLNGYFVQYAGYKKHIGFYTTPTTIEAFKEELTQYKTNTKNTVQFPHNMPLPGDLIERMVEYRTKEMKKIY